MTDAEFWNLTPREFHALQQRHQQQTRLDNYRAGIMPAMYFNAHRKKTREALKPLDFFAERKPMQTAEQIAGVLNRLDSHLRSRNG